MKLTKPAYDLLLRGTEMVTLPVYCAASLNTNQEQVVQYYVNICESSPVVLNLPVNMTHADNF